MSMLMIANLPLIQTDNTISLAPLLVRTFAALDEAGISYCLLRGFDELVLKPETGDIDLLVSAEQHVQLQQVLSTAGYVYLHRWGQSPHHFYIGFDQRSSSWLKLDVVTTLSYGQPVPVLQTTLAEHCLQHRQWNGYCWVASAEDEVLTLLLHCLLDKANFKSNYQSRLRELVENVEDEEFMTAQVAALFSSSLTWTSLKHMVRNNAWAELLRLRHAVADRLEPRSPIIRRWRTRTTRLLRFLDRRTRTYRTRGIAVSLLAPDGGGKTTLAHTLVDTFYLPGRYVYMGTNRASSTINLPTSRWLENEHRNLPRPLLRVLRAVNSFVEQIVRYRYGAYQRRRGRLVVFDRYPTNSLVCQKAKLPHKRLRQWLIRRLCPTPDLVILLDAPGSVLYERKQDHPPEVLEQQRQHYLQLVRNVPGAIVVNVEQDLAGVHGDVVSAIWRRYATQQNSI